MANLKNASSLENLSRTVVNKNVKREDVDSLPLPRLLKDECFANIATDRSGETIRRPSLEPCKCCKFPENFSDSWSWIRQWRGSFEFGARLLYSPELPGLATRAEWLELPDRTVLAERLRSAKSIFEKERMQACLNTLRFDSSTGLGDVHEWIRRYLFYRNEHGWYHLTVNTTHMQKFLRAMDDICVVVLPYGCVTGSCGRVYVNSDWRNIILVVKNDDIKFRRAMDTLEGESFINTCVKIHDAARLAESLAFVGTQRVEKRWSCLTKNYVVFQPMIDHAFWWMLLLIPTDYAKQRYNQREELEIQNCVVLFDPLHQCIGDPVETWRDDRPHVYWLDEQILNVKEIEDVPHKQNFIRWCVARKMNTLLNLNGNCWSQRPTWFQSDNRLIT